MDVQVNIDQYDFRNSMDSAIKDAIHDHVEPKVAEYLKENINDEKVAEILMDKLKSTLSYGSWENRASESGVVKMFNDHICEVARNIKDEDLKNYLFEAILNRTDK